MTKRSPRYPRLSLSKSLEMTKKLFAGAHQAKIDVDTAARVIGYASSSGGAAASAIGALRQYGLVDGLRGEVSVSEMALRILQPMTEEERFEAMKEAALKPEIFGRVYQQFGGSLPSSNEPVRAFLIRQEGFSAGGADEMIAALRDTMTTIAELNSNRSVEAVAQVLSDQVSASELPPTSPSEKNPPNPAYYHPGDVAGSELINLPLGANCRAELRFFGKATAAAYGRLIKHLQLMREMLDEDDADDKGG